jgi:hypothetical protein
MVVTFAVVWRVEVSAHHPAHPPQPFGAPIAGTIGSTPIAPSVHPDDGIPTGPGPIATTQELNKPWAGRRFLFHNQTLNSTAPAEVVRLPGGSFWAVSLREPFGTCRMEYVTDMKVLRDDYQVNASHPMVADPCSHAVFDLAEYGSGPNGLVRGDVIAGFSSRPPIAIEVKVQGSQVIAVRSE